MIRLSVVERAVGSMATHLMDLDRKVAGFVTSISDLVRVQTLPTLGAPTPGPLNNSPNEEWNIASLQGESQDHPQIRPTPKISLMVDKSPQNKRPRRSCFISYNREQPRSLYSGGEG